MSAAPDLKRTQELFWALITAPEGVRTALFDLKRRGLITRTDLTDVFVGGEELPAVERVDIYANMYFYRLLDCLREDYPRVEAALGGPDFHNLVTDYLLRHPSGHPSLRCLGKSLPEFIAGHPIHREVPYLRDLARLEWARVEVFDAPDVSPITRGDLARLPEERAGEARFSLAPACAMLRFDYDVVGLWKDLKPRGEAESLEPGTEANAAAQEHACLAPARGPRDLLPRKTRVRVWRSGFIVYHKRIDEEEARCLERLAAGDSLGVISQQVAAGRSLNRTMQRVGRLLQGWLDDGILAEVKLPG